MTNYERGLVKVLPMKAHLTLDAVSGGMLLGAAMFFDDEPDEVRAMLAGIGLFEIFAALSTQTKSTNEIRRRAATTARVAAAVIACAIAEADSSPHRGWPRAATPERTSILLQEIPHEHAQQWRDEVTRTHQRRRIGRHKALPTRPNTQIEMRLEANRPVSSGTKHRGDRRDTNAEFTGSRSRQSTLGDPLGSGKKQVQGGGKGLKSSGRKRK